MEALIDTRPPGVIANYVRDHAYGAPQPRSPRHRR